MTSIIVTTTTTSIPGWASLAYGDSVIIAPSGQVVDVVTDYTVGSIDSLGFDISGYMAVNSLNIGGYNHMVIGETGALNLLDGTLRIGGTSSNSGSYLANLGTVSAKGDAIHSANGSEIYNSGMILSSGTAIEMNVAGGGDRLVNDGSIIGGGSYCIGLNRFTSWIVNHGVIMAQGQGADLGEVGISVRGHATILNTGLIEGDSAAIRLEDTTPGPSCDLYNSGTIRGGTYSFFGIQGFVASDSIVNRGLMDGSIYTSLGNDLVDTRGGTVDGHIELSSGNDTLQAMGATITGVVDGSIGSDTYWTDDSDLTIVEELAAGDVNQVYARCNFRLGDNIDTLFLLGFADFRGIGNGIDNLVQGNAGDNRLSGLAGADTINGDVGDDLINGGSQDDSISGDDGHDTLQGGVGNDTLLGSAGNDLFVGGTGLDVMTGGLGEDVFQFTAIAQSTDLRLTADVITDFKIGEDQIDLSKIDAITDNAISDDAFAFIGATAFSNVAGQLRSMFRRGETTVEADLDGDGVADFVLALTGGMALNAGDFSL